MKDSVLLIALVVAALVVTACGGAPAAPAPQPAEQPAAPAAEVPAAEEPTPTAAAPVAEAPAGGLPAVDPMAVAGDIIIAGSSTVYPLTEAIAERFQDEGFAGNVTIDSIGTGAGFERFCKSGETDISNASRPIKDSERENCRAIGREPIEFRVGTDALAVVVNPNNEFLADVTLEQLAKIFSADATNWSDIDPSWPAEPILRFSPGTDSGTFDYFIEAVMDPAYVKDKEADKGKGEAALLAAANLQLSEDDNVLVQGVEGDKNAIGYFGYAYYQENAARLKLLKINGIEATDGTVEDGSYPLARPLFIYSSARIMQEKPQVNAFINFYLTYVGRVGYFPASEAALQAARAAWLAAQP